MLLSERILEKVVDIALVMVFFNMEAVTRKRRDWINLDFYVGEDLEEISYEKLKRALTHLRKKGFLQTIKERNVLPIITQEGKKRLLSTIPHYDTNRAWDKRVYLITYDLPLPKNKERNYLRIFLRKIGCGMLQKSVWVTPYNPTNLINEFIKKKGLNDLILVSSLGRDGTVGNFELTDLFIEIYHLRELNSEYLEFLSLGRERKLSNDQLIFRYLNILGKDPQLPFPLLPDWWKGDMAYKYFKFLSQNKLQNDSAYAL